MGSERSDRRLLVIHAGTHKTASSYIQSCMAANQALLRHSGVLVEYPALPPFKHKPLADALAKRHWDYWHQYLKALPKDQPLVLISGEQFTQILARRRVHQHLLTLLDQEGFRLGVAVFLRDQPDYINSRFVHSTRRFYHALDFEDYVRAQLADRKHIYNYNRLFFGLATHPLIQTYFLPYGRELGDPFERLLSALGVDPPSAGWQAADPDKTNVQPGCRAVWLAQRISARLQHLGMDSRSLVNTGDVVRRIATREDWSDDRYCGFNQESAAAVAAHYARSNHRFARRVWGCDWGQMVPHVPLKTCVYHPPVQGPERDHLESLVDQGIRDLARENPRLRWSLWRRSALSMIPMNRE
jgi:hypothetical protein